MLEWSWTKAQLVAHSLAGSWTTKGMLLATVVPSGSLEKLTLGVLTEAGCGTAVYSYRGNAERK